MVMSQAEFCSETGIRLQSTFMHKKSSDELIAICNDLGDLANQPKFAPQARWAFMLALAGKCESYLSAKEQKGRNLIKPKHRCIDRLTTQLVQQMSKEMAKADMYGSKVGQYDRMKGAVPMGRNNPGHGKVKFELALGGKGNAPVVNGQTLWNQARDANVALTGNESQDAYILRSWLKHLARSNQLKRHGLKPIEYCDSQQRQRYELTFDGTGCSQGNARFDTTAGWVPDEVGAGCLAISTGGEWYAKADRFNAGTPFHHSSFLAGAPVMLAGTIRVAAGKVHYISNGSGHYAPKIADLLNGALQLRHCGLDNPARHDVSILACDFENKYAQKTTKYLFPYSAFVNGKGNVPNPANYEVEGKYEHMYWKNPAAPRPGHRCRVGPADTDDGVTRSRIVWPA